MKNYKQLVESLPPKTIVFAFGRFNPPTAGHELLVKAVKKLAVINKADHVIYASRTQNSKKDPLDVNKKIHYLNIMFPNIRFVAASEQTRTFMEAVKLLNAKYKNLIMVAGSDRTLEYQNLLEKYNGKEFNYDSIQVVSAGERDPDSDSVSGISASKMRLFASKGDYKDFKKGLPSRMRDIDGKLLMNDVRMGLNLDPIKEQVKFDTEDIREQYYKGEIFHEGQIVESNDIEYTIIKRGTNHLLLEDQEGKKISKWISDVKSISGSNMKTYKELQTEAKEPRVVPINKKSNRNAAGDIMNYSDFKKNLELNKGVKESSDPHKVIKDKLDSNKPIPSISDDEREKHKARMKAQADEYIKKQREKKGYSLYKLSTESEENPENIDTDNMDDLEDIQVMDADGKIYNIKKWDFRRVGHSLGADGNDSLRRMRVKYKMNEETLDEGQNYTVTLQHTHPDGKKENFDYKVTGANNDRHAAWKAMKIHDQKKIPHKMIAAIHKKLDEDTVSESKNVVINGKHLDHSSVKVDGINHRDRPDYSDAYISHAKFKNGKELTDKEYDELHDKHRDYVRSRIESSVHEDVNTADFKISDETGRKYRAHKVSFANSKNGGRPDNTPNPDEDELEYKRNNKKLGESLDEVIQQTGTSAIIAREDEISFTKAEKKTKKPDAKVKDDSGKLGNNNAKGFDAFFLEEYEDDKDYTEDDIDDIVDDVDDEDVLDTYDEDELSIIDDETGELVEELVGSEDLDEETLNEVLSRQERIKARLRFAKTKSIRARKLKIALKRRSGSAVINKRARKLAVMAIKKRLARKPLNKLTLGEKERIEKMVAKKKKLINRLSMKLVSKVRRTENDRLSHKKYTK